MSDDPSAALTTTDAVAQLSFRVHALLEAHAADHGISLIQMRLLGILRDRRPTVNELARLLGLDKSSVSGLVDRAERRGLVARSPSPHDGRSVLVSLTTGGRRLARTVSDAFDTDVEALLAPLSQAEGDALTAVLQRVLVADAAAHGVSLLTTVD